MDIIAFDLATQTGWARYAPAGTIRFGSFRMPYTGPAVGLFLTVFRERIAELIEEGPDVIVFETPWVGSKTSQDTARKLMCLAGFLEFECHQFDIRCFEVNNAAVRKFFCGKGRAPRLEIKALVMNACLARGWSPRNDDEADALAVLDFALDKFGIEVPWSRVGGLFATVPGGTNGA